ncbi:ROK family protein [Pedobacter aquatilis]|uniref:ROK family protein n=1 Tax=Pedobacter aquatilis TaxID=351343 RepID=UPI0025B5CEF5|nr:ROK family protein [Pedobacter aquatilis]MDN3588505.1 ROK family protein [Pedobacter aquatilis]
MNANIAVGVDIGGSHIIAALVDLSDGSIIKDSTFRQKVNAAENHKSIITTWCKVIESSLQSFENSGNVGIAMPGPFDYENGISYMKGMGKYDALYGLNVKQLISEQLGEQVKSVSFFNDAGCFLQGELSHGSIAHFSKVMGFTLGTGFGSARGILGVAQDADYWRHPFMGGICEDLFSSRWFVSKYNAYAQSNVSNVKELIDNAILGGPMLQVFDEFSLNLGAFLTQIHKKERFECVVLGGNIAKASGLFLPQLKQYLKTMSVEADILISIKGEDAALIGAAFLA